MKFTTRQEAYSYAILCLTYLQKAQPNVAEILHQTIEEIKILFENHVTDINHLTELLQVLSQKTEIKHPYKEKLQNLIKEIGESDFQLTTQQKFENLLARRFESELPIVLLASPTENMMKAVSKISQLIIILINQLSRKDKYSKPFEEFRSRLQESGDATTFGGFQTKPYLHPKVISILEKNNPKKLVNIMHIHYKFALCLMRVLPINGVLPKREPIGKYAELIKQHFGSYQSYLQAIKQENKSGFAARNYISNKVIYQSLLYTAESNRGRKGEIKDILHRQLGLLLTTQYEFATNYELADAMAAWIPDAKEQEADLDSHYVRDLIENDAVYVSGPSGMCSLLLSLMELRNFKTLAMKQHYLTAMLAYIVAGGFHSIHEVISPAQYCLDLMPGYQVHLPVDDQLAPSPNYHTAFETLSQIDPQFAQRREAAWQIYMDFFEKNYMEKCMLESLETLYEDFEIGETLLINEFLFSLQKAAKQYKDQAEQSKTLSCFFKLTCDFSAEVTQFTQTQQATTLGNLLADFSLFINIQEKNYPIELEAFLDKFFSLIKKNPAINKVSC